MRRSACRAVAVRLLPCDLSVSVRNTPGSCPVWIDMQQLTLLDQLQTSTGGAMSDATCSRAVSVAHRRTWRSDEPAASKEPLQISLTSLDETQMLRYLSTGVRELRQLHLRAHQGAQAAVPPHTIGRTAQSVTAGTHGPAACNRV
jgi:hypothetical protein